MMLSRRFVASIFSLCLMCAVHARAGQTSAVVASRASDAAAVPQLVQFSGLLKNFDGKAATGVVGITFLLYADEEGGQPLWRETQNVELEADGRYTVMLGAGTEYALPSELFAAGQARWLAIEPQGLPAPARVMLLSVPYAMKAGDAETLGGLPASAFLRSGPVPRADLQSASASAQTAAESATAASTNGSGTANYIPRWTPDGATLGNSVLFQSGTGSTAKIGINKTIPVATLDVNGSISANQGMTANGGLLVPARQTGTAAKGYPSQGITLRTSAFSSSKNEAVTPEFLWQAEPNGNNTATPGATLNLLYGGPTTLPGETGLKIAGNGQITFAPGQTFPGAGNSTITAVSAGPGLSGGGTKGNVTLGLDTTKVPLLNAANAFTGDQTVNGNVSSSASVSGSILGFSTSLNLGADPFAFGTKSTGSVYLGFAGNQKSTSPGNTAVGVQALLSVGSGDYNTALGYGALAPDSGGSQNVAVGSGALGGNTAGSNNTAIGTFSLNQSTTGSNNTAVGYEAGPAIGATNLTNATAIGANTEVSASNSLVLGSINGVHGATADTLVGIGTTAPTAKLDVHGSANFTGLVTFAAAQTFPGTISGVTAGTGLSGGGTTGSPTLSLDTTYSDGRYAQLGANIDTFTGRVGIGIAPAAGYVLHANGAMRAETKLSLGGTASLSVDAPGSPGGHFLVDGTGNVGINNRSPSQALDVIGSIRSSGNVTASGTLTGGSLNVGGDTPMSAAPHMTIGGFVPGGIPAGVDVNPIFMVPTRNILITRMSAYGINRCTGGDQTYTLYLGSAELSQNAKYTLTIGTTTFTSDSGALSIPVPAGTPVVVFSNLTPSCGLGVAAGDIAVSVEYVMQ